jgi:hypothetical protein
MIVAPSYRFSGEYWKPERADGDNPRHFFSRATGWIAAIPQAAGLDYQPGTPPF